MSPASHALETAFGTTVQVVVLTAGLHCRHGLPGRTAPAGVQETFASTILQYPGCRSHTASGRQTSHEAQLHAWHEMGPVVVPFKAIMWRLPSPAGHGSQLGF